MNIEIRQIFNTYKRSPFSLVVRLCLLASIAFTVGILAFLLVYILAKGIPYLSPELFSLNYTSENVSMMPGIITTVMMVAAALVISLPFGIFSAVYLVEYAPKGSKIVDIIRLTTETLSGIPSIVYGLFGNIFFVTTLKWGYSFMAGVMTISIMILPLIMRNTEEALLSVPDDWRQASFGLGAGRLRTVFRVVLPSAVPGIMAGVILGVGRIVGETAALIYTLGTMAKIPDSVFSSGRTLALHMWVLSGEGLHINQAYATAVVLIFIVLAINSVSGMIAKQIQKR